jgi:AAA domain
LKRLFVIVFALICALLAGVILLPDYIEKPATERPWDKSPSGPPKTLPDDLRTSLAGELSVEYKILQEFQQTLDTYKITSDPKDDDKTLQDLQKFHQAVHVERPNLDELTNLFPLLQNNWKAQALLARSTLLTPPDLSTIPELPAFAAALYHSVSDTTEGQEYDKLYSQVHARVQDLRSQTLAAWETRVTREYLRMLKWHQVRSRFLAAMYDLDAPGLLAWTPENLDTMALELKLIPYHYEVIWVANKVDLRQRVERGLTGWFVVLRNVAGLLLSGFSVVLIYFVLTRFVDWLRKVALNTELPTGIVPWTPLLLSLLPWLGLFLVLDFAAKMLSSRELLFELSLIPAVGKFYVLYRAIVLLARALLHRLLRTAPLQEREPLARKIRATSTVVGSAIGLTAAFRYLVFVSIGQAMLYWDVTAAIPWIALITFCSLAFFWRSELPLLVELTFGRAIRRRLEPVSAGALSWLASPVLLAGVLSGIGLLGSAKFASRFDWFNRLIAGLLRKRLGTSTRTEKPLELPASYREKFRQTGDSSDFVINSDGHRFDSRLKDSIQAWIEGRIGAEFLVLAGRRGSGRSTYLNRLSEHFEETLRVVRLRLPAKTVTERDLARCLGDALGVGASESESSDALYEALIDAPRTLVLVEDTQNIFLARVGGFEAFSALGRFLRINRCHFCLSFDRDAWNYISNAFLDQALTPDVFDIPKWPAQALRDQILSRHKQTGYSLVFDDSLLRATLDPDDLPNVERAFFRLLWDQSDGNPGIAEELWFGSLSQIHGDETTLLVGPPPIHVYDVLDRLDDNSLFLFAALFRHGNLTPEEATMVTALPERFTHRAINRGLERGLLEQLEGERIRVHLQWSVPLERYLRRRNFLYER